ncbi:MAG: antA/AntB antirepressor family protein [Ferrovum myxofaciens]|uniref:antA/AntB antirepressor family protein n=1 Tax=Ferrovum myxofaciens TaxID=416213 RepID=UPI002353F4FA|nr:antA/AntB antirepressor family protein [Ferrovum myxofaciens]QKE41952.1 MAG: antA/AntB antirepressor family protein [Ferrovum myxofaciens]
MTTPRLIPVLTGTLNGQSVQLVDARHLHDFLGVGRDFSNWIKGRIQEYGFVENQDYLLAKTGENHPIGSIEDFTPVLGKSRGGRPSVDYFLTLDMAKELAMVECTAQGRKVRRYFIDCERQIQQLQQGLTQARSVALIELSRAERQAINRQAWADVAGDAQAKFYVRREALLRQCVPSGESGPISLPDDFLPDWAK